MHPSSPVANLLAVLLLSVGLAACGGSMTSSGGEANEAAHQAGRTGENPAPDQAQTASPQERDAINKGATPEQIPPPADH